jgi:hypothetical protein
LDRANESWTNAGRLLDRFGWSSFKFGRLIANGKAFIAALMELKELESLANATRWHLSGSTGEKPSSHLATIPLKNTPRPSEPMRTRESTWINNEEIRSPKLFCMDDSGLVGGFKHLFIFHHIWDVILPH